MNEQTFFNRYARQISIPEIGCEGQKRLQLAKILCVGAGGLGCPAVVYLAASGIGKIGLIDQDKVELSNLQRQILYTEDDVNTAKVLAAKNKLQKLNSEIEIQTYEENLSLDNATKIIQGYDIILDCTDNLETRYLINDICYQLNKPFIYASVNHFEGQCAVFFPKQKPCFRCLFPEPPPKELIPNCNEIGVLGVVPGFLGMLQANEAIKLILNLEGVILNQLLTINLLNLELKKFPIIINKDCLLCAKQMKFEDLPRYITRECLMSHIPEIDVYELKKLLQHEQVFILDVRNPHEYEICNLNGVLIPLDQLEARMNEIPNCKHLVVHCKAGGRGAKAVEVLQQRGFKHAVNLKGGILAWIDAIDPNMPKY